MKYRPEIDGLRAVAIVPVVLFHAGIAGFSGGYVGVDVFFMISGYLITTIILADMEQGRFSLAHFYERRARRILPALFLVMLACLPFAWFWLMPSDMQDFSKSLLAVATFSSNILFWHESGYWGAPNALKPLLHTWSLAVEEQYYVLFPLFLMLTWRFRRRWILGIFLSIAAASLLLAEWGTRHWPVLDFFMLPTRAWEIAIGAAIAFYFLYRQRTMRALLPSRAIDDAMGMLGLAMIAYAVVRFDPDTPIPGFDALIPTLGAALIIVFTSARTRVGRLLGSRLPVGLGLISYSLYLWHQPILAFARQRSLLPPGPALVAALIGLSVLLAYASWRWVERPFRDKRAIGRRPLFAFATTGSLAFVALGLTGYMTHGFAGRQAPSGVAMQGVEDRLASNKGLGAACDGPFTLAPQCRTSEDPEIMVWGDSYAMAAARGIVASNPKARLIQFTQSACGPFFDVAPVAYSADWQRGCLQFNDDVRRWLAGKHHALRYAVLASPFGAYIDKDKRLLLRDGRTVPAGYDFAVRAFTRTLDTLRAHGVTPVVIAPPPETGTDLGRCLARAALFGDSLDACNFKTSAIAPGSRLVDRFMREIGRHARVIHLRDFICEHGVCHAHFGPDFLYMDTGHLSVEGSAALGRRMDLYDRIVGKAPTPPR